MRDCKFDSREHKREILKHVSIVKIFVFVIAIIAVANFSMFAWLRWGGDPIITPYKGEPWIEAVEKIYEPKQIVKLIGHNFCKNYAIKGEVRLQVVDGINMGELTQDVNLPKGCWESIEIYNAGIPIPCEAHDGTYNVIMRVTYPPRVLKDEETYKIESKPFTVLVREGNAC